MQEIKNRFMDEIIECLSKEDVDIPYMIASLVQAIDYQEFDRFFKDLTKYRNYSFTYEEDTTGGYTLGCIVISLHEEQRDVYPNYSYEIQFGFIDQCGWESPIVVLNKIENIIQYKFDGDENSYLDFEEKFYMIRQEVKDHLDQKDREDRITYLKENICKMQIELGELA